MSNSEELEFCATELQWDNKLYYCLWDDSGTVDLFLIDPDNHIKYFPSIFDLEAFCHKNSLPLCEERNKYNLDIIVEWLKTPHADIDCDSFLDVWNVVSDLAHSIHEPFCGDDDGEIRSVYNKLFYGCNLPTINTSGKEYIPVWPEDEIIILLQVLKNAVEIVDKCFTYK
jgi:hypothetical protein